MLDINVINRIWLKSTVSFCEKHYTLPTNVQDSIGIISEHTLLTSVGDGRGIVEFWNSFSGINLIVSSFIFYYNNKKWLKQNEETEFNFIIIRNLLYWIGSVTILFHFTLLYIFQLLNHIAIILLLREYIIILLSLQITKKTFLESSYKNLVGVIHNVLEYIIIIVSTYFISINLQVVSFHLTFKILELVLIFIFYNLSRSLNKIIYYNLTKKCRNHGCTKMLDIAQENIKKYVKLRKFLKQQIKKGLYFYILSIILWIFQNNFCNYINLYGLHELFYLFSSFGVYYLNNILKIYIQINTNFYTL